MKGLLLFILFMAYPLLANNTLHYSGRLVNSGASGVPVEGPVDLRVKIYQNNSEICMLDYLSHADQLANVSLSNGLFNIDLDFSTSCNGDSLNSRFQEYSSDQFEIEITDVTHNKIYQKQRIGSFPLALYAYDAKASSTDGLKFFDRDGSKNYVEIRSADALTQNYTFTLPQSYGTAGQVLKTDGMGGLSWITPAAGGSSAIESIITSDSSGLSGGGNAGNLSLSVNLDNNFFELSTNRITLKNQGVDAAKLKIHPWHFTDNLGQLQLILGAGLENTMLGTSIKTDGSTITLNGSGALEVGSIPAAKITGLVIPNTSDHLGNHTATEKLNMNNFQVSNLAEPTLTTDAATKNYVDTQILSAGDFKKDGSVALTGSLKFQNGEHQTLALSMPATVPGDYSLTLPATSGTAGQVLSTDGSGILSWLTLAVPATPPTANGTTDGLLSAADWTTFTQKQSALPSGLSSDYIGGDHQLHSLPDATRQTNLSGFVVGTNNVITSADTVLSSIEKAQGQLNALNFSVSSHSSALDDKVSKAAIPNCQGSLERLTWNAATESWSCSTLQDHLGNHTATENLKMNGRWISSDGDNEGIFVDDAGIVGVSSQLNTDRVCSAGGFNCQQLEWQVINSHYTAKAGDKLFVDTSAGVVQITLPPSASQGDSVQIVDRMGTFNLHKLTVLGNGQDIMGINEAMDVDLKNISFSLVLGGGSAGWRIQ